MQNALFGRRKGIPMKGLIKRNGIYHYRIFAQGRELVRSTGCTELRAATPGAKRTGPNLAQ